jgi:phosphoribosylformylglycinamidine synthase
VKAIILRTAGTNCDIETKFACEKAGFETDLIYIDKLVLDKRILKECNLFVIPGGFTYGDDISAGKVLANQLRFKIKDAIIEFVERGGLVLGICNGFQVLTKCGLLPNPNNSEPTVTLTDNASGRFEARWVYLKVCSKKSEFIKGEGDIIELPVAHGEGRFVVRERGIMDNLLKNNQVVLRYVSPEGKSAGYPYNPNGSMEDVAGICDPSGRILGLMPHPERFCDILQHPQWTRRSIKRVDGMLFFQNAIRYVKSK